MAMNKGNESATTGMASEFYSNFLIELANMGVSFPIEFNPLIMKAMCYAMAKTIVEHLGSNMEVGGISSSVAVASVSGVTVGAGTSGPGSGSASQVGTVHPT